MSKHVFASFTVPGTGIDIRCYRDRDATENQYSVYVRYPERVPDQTWLRYPERIVYRFTNYKDCAVCMTDLVTSLHYINIDRPHVIPYLLSLIEHNYRPVPKANRKEE